jgi:hypothetical protein
MNRIVSIRNFRQTSAENVHEFFDRKKAKSKGFGEGDGTGDWKAAV